MVDKLTIGHLAGSDPDPISVLEISAELLKFRFIEPAQGVVEDLEILGAAGQSFSVRLESGLSCVVVVDSVVDDVVSLRTSVGGFGGGMTAH